MKTVYFMRHAKSSWDNLSLSDHDRPLNSRGIKNATNMAKYLKDKNETIDIIISSTALRAFETAEHFNEIIQTYNLIKEPNLYHSSPREILNVVNNIHEEVDSAMIVAHNPGMTELINLFSKEDIYNVPTAGLFKVNFDTKTWEQASFANGTMEYFIYPKSFADE
ncbi:MAG: histidine phosphatase family protein [Saprospiraceae bacterium]